MVKKKNGDYLNTKFNFSKWLFTRPRRWVVPKITFSCRPDRMQPFFIFFLSILVRTILCEYRCLRVEVHFSRKWLDIRFNIYKFIYVLYVIILIWFISEIVIFNQIVDPQVNHNHHIHSTKSHNHFWFYTSLFISYL